MDNIQSDIASLDDGTLKDEIGLTYNLINELNQLDQSIKDMQDFLDLSKTKLDDEYNAKINTRTSRNNQFISMQSTNIIQLMNNKAGLITTKANLKLKLNDQVLKLKAMSTEEEDGNNAALVASLINAISQKASENNPINLDRSNETENDDLVIVEDGAESIDDAIASNLNKTDKPSEKTSTTSTTNDVDQNKADIEDMYTKFSDAYQYIKDSGRSQGSDVSLIYNKDYGFKINIANPLAPEDDSIQYDLDEYLDDNSSVFMSIEDYLAYIIDADLVKVDMDREVALEPNGTEFDLFEMEA